MRVLAICQQRDAGVGVFADGALAAGATLDEWFIAETPAPPADPFSYDAVISFGGAMHPDQDSEYPWLAEEKALLGELLAREMPLLGVCLGAQLLVVAAGGEVRRASTPEIGWRHVELTAQAADDPLLGALAPGFEAFHWHSYECVPPPGAITLARNSVCVQAFRVGMTAYGIQFHAEVSAFDAEHWIDDYQTDPDAIRIGLDPEAVQAATRERIGAWNELGREFCERFIGLASRRSQPSAGSASVKVGPGRVPGPPPAENAG